MTAIPEIARRLVGGQWRTNVVDEGGGNGGSQAGASRWLGPCKINAFAGQTIQVSGSGSITGGTYTLTINGETTSALAADTLAPVVVAALNALPSIDGAAALDDAAGDQSANSIVSGGFYVQVVFEELSASGLLTLDASALTGPDAPYSDGTAPSAVFAIPLITPAVGDIIEDFMHSNQAAWDGAAFLNYTDAAPEPSATSPDWSNPGTWSGISGDGLDLGVENEFTNFSGNGSAGDVNKPTALQAMVAAPITNESADIYSNLPAVALNSAPVYSAISTDGTQSTGEVWIWVKTATPAPDMD